MDARSRCLPRYRDLLGEADRWFAHAADAQRDRIRCGPGCDRCCRGLFDITPLDAALVADAVRRADAATRVAMDRAARATLEAIRAAAPDWGAPWRVGDIGADRFDALCETLDELPCPALDERGACRIYASRPLICRLHGLPMFDPGTGQMIGGACPLNMPEEAARHDASLHFAHEDFEGRELELIAEHAGRAAADDPEAHATIVAAAVVAAGADRG